MDFNRSDSILSSNNQNVSVNDHLQDLFIDEWLLQMNYSKYFDQCAPSFCIYTTTDEHKLSYAITLFISLYGGLIIILRLITSFLVDISLKCHLKNININDGNF